MEIEFDLVRPHGPTIKCRSFVFKLLVGMCATYSSSHTSTSSSMVLKLPLCLRGGEPGETNLKRKRWLKLFKPLVDVLDIACIVFIFIDLSYRQVLTCIWFGVGDPGLPSFVLRS